ncbi:MAG: hypothetical protein MI741_00095, partial [Rhodospirillales bacterium]|nr:hypothetical protein [Rhodospirillales bacterium]
MSALDLAMASVARKPHRARTVVPRDIPSVAPGTLGRDDPSFFWPVPHDRYLSATIKLRRRIVSLAYDAALPDLVAA